MDMLKTLMEWLNGPFGWAVAIVICVPLLPILGLVMTYVFQILGTINTWINIVIIDKISIPPIKDWAQNKQVDILQAGIVSIQKSIEKIKEA